jgi:hypothetical protein
MSNNQRTVFMSSLSSQVPLPELLLLMEKKFHTTNGLPVRLSLDKENTELLRETSVVRTDTLQLTTYSSSLSQVNVRLKSIQEMQS